MVTNFSIANMARFSMVALMSVMLLACAGAATKTGRVVEDSVITTKIKSKLLATKNVSGTAIAVETYKGVVQLSGFVKHEEEKRIATAVAKAVNGVTKVINSIQIRE